MERAFEIDVRKSIRPEVAGSRADLGLMEECKQFPHRIAFLCFAGDAIVAFTCLLAAFWLRFDTVLRDFGVEAPGIVLEQLLQLYYFRLLSLCCSCSLRSRCMTAPGCFTGTLRSRTSSSRALIWGAGFLGFSLFFKFQPPLSRVYVALATVAAMTGLYTWRRLFFRYLRQESIAGKLRQRILVVGWTAHAQRLKEIIENDPSHPYEMVCCVPTPEGTFQQQPPQSVQSFDSYKVNSSSPEYHGARYCTGG